MKWAIVRSLIVIAALLGVGCATTTGAPKKPYTEDHVKDLTADQPLKALLGTTLASDRNKQTFLALAVVDLRYNEFKQAMEGDRKHTASIADALTLAMTIAGSLTESAGVKQNYLQGIALVTGGMSIYDKNYLYSQTITALVAQMDANRKKKLAEMLKSMGDDIDKYPATAAYNDVLEYYQSGSVLGALMGIQADAKAKEQTIQATIPALMQQVK
jgi:hypothetical protein